MVVLRVNAVGSALSDNNTLTQTAELNVVRPDGLEDEDVVSYGSIWLVGTDAARLTCGQEFVLTPKPVNG